MSFSKHEQKQYTSTYLKGLFTNFEYVIFFSCLNKRNILYKRSISIKQSRLEMIEKSGAQLFRARVVLLDGPFIKNVSIVETRKH